MSAPVRICNTPSNLISTLEFVEWLNDEKYCSSLIKGQMIKDGKAYKVCDLLNVFTEKK